MKDMLKISKTLQKTKWQTCWLVSCHSCRQRCTEPQKSGACSAKPREWQLQTSKDKVQPFRQFPPWCLALCACVLCNGFQSVRAPHTFACQPINKRFPWFQWQRAQKFVSSPANRQDTRLPAPQPVSHWRGLELAWSRVTWLPGALPWEGDTNSLQKALDDN